MNKERKRMICERIRKEFGTDVKIRRIGLCPQIVGPPDGQLMISIIDLDGKTVSGFGRSIDELINTLRQNSQTYV